MDNYWAESLPIAQVSGLKRRTVYARLRRGWTAEQACIPESCQGVRPDAIILRGQTIGRWTVVAPYIDMGGVHLVECPMGHQVSALADFLNNDRACHVCEQRLHTDDVVGAWTLRQRVGANNGKQAAWRCICACGKRSLVSEANLTSGLSKGCPSCSVREKHLYDYDGRSMSLKEIAEISGIKYTTLRVRLRRGWGLKEALAGRRGALQVA